MGIRKENELGTLILSDELIAGIVSSAFTIDKINGFVWASTRHGRLIDRRDVPDAQELAPSIDVKEREDGRLELEFSVIVNFGTSIKRVTKILADAVRERIRDRLGLDAGAVIIDIAGVRSKQIAKRTTRIVYEYGNEPD